MDSGLYAACAGLVARTQSLDTIANNLANASTTGFRARHNTFSSVLASTGQHHLSLVNQDANDYGVLGGTHIDSTQGSLSPTGNELDMAIEGPGYFQIKTAKGSAFTRAGSFRISAQRELVTITGDKVLGENGEPISIVGSPVSISGDGTISSNGAVSGKIKLVEFKPGVQPENFGADNYSVPDKDIEPATNSHVRQGMLENSNVNPTTSVVELITAQREVETMRHVLTMFNSEMDKTATQDLPRVS